MNIQSLNEELSQLFEAVDYYDAQVVLGDNYTLSYVTTIEKGDKGYEAWFIHEKKDGANVQIKDEKLYQEVADKLNAKFGEGVLVTTRQYKYAPEIQECLLLLPLAGYSIYKQLKPGSKFTIEDEVGVYTVEEIDNGVIHCECEVVDAPSYSADVYIDQLENATLITDESFSDECSRISTEIEDGYAGGENWSFFAEVDGVTLDILSDYFKSEVRAAVAEYVEDDIEGCQFDLSLDAEFMSKDALDSIVYDLEHHLHKNEKDIVAFTSGEKPIYVSVTYTVDYTEPEVEELDESSVGSLLKQYESLT